LSAKAFDLGTADESPFGDVRILSDIRPIFRGPESQLSLRGSIVVHHLVIEVQGASDDLYCALSTNDLLKLKRIVERALEKDKMLRSALQGGPLAPLDVVVPPMDRDS